MSKIAKGDKMILHIHDRWEDEFVVVRLLSIGGKKFVEVKETRGFPKATLRYTEERLREIEVVEL